MKVLFFKNILSCSTRWILHLSLLSLILVPASSFSQSWNLSGNVKYCLGKISVKQSEVRAIHNGRVQAQATLNNSGYYEFENLEYKQYEIVVFHILSQMEVRPGVLGSNVIKRKGKEPVVFNFCIGIDTFPFNGSSATRDIELENIRLVRSENKYCDEQIREITEGYHYYYHCVNPLDYVAPYTYINRQIAEYNAVIETFLNEKNKKDWLEKAELKIYKKFWKKDDECDCPPHLKNQSDF